MSDGPSDATAEYFAVEPNVRYLISVVHNGKHCTIAGIKKIEVNRRPGDRSANRSQADIVGRGTGFYYLGFKHSDTDPAYITGGSFVARSFRRMDSLPAFQIASRVT